ncbi:hypothetical protein [Aurantiacibacter zhengii]|uniref:hypothetical protein n=1 Tax=Aurantiacibacter zhengii TaxID=2307003 RepID=UPI001315028B|nr:hypothetical protein [Aurantiacibacter zhengii]
MKWLRVALREGVTVEGAKAGNLPNNPDLDGSAGNLGQGAGDAGLDPDDAPEGW